MPEITPFSRHAATLTDIITGGGGGGGGGMLIGAIEHYGAIARIRINTKVARDGAASMPGIIFRC